MPLCYTVIRLKRVEKFHGHRRSSATDTVRNPLEIRWPPWPRGPNDSIGVGAQSILGDGARHFSLKIVYDKLTICQKFT